MRRQIRDRRPPKVRVRPGRVRPSTRAPMPSVTRPGRIVEVPVRDWKQMLDIVEGGVSRIKIGRFLYLEHERDQHYAIIDREDEDARMSLTLDELIQAGDVARLLKARSAKGP